MNKKMKIALLGGAVKNAGDYLIVKRSRELLEHIYPSCEIQEFQRNCDLTEYLDEINRCDVLIFGGGPGYFSGFYPKMMPLVPDLSLIKVPIFVLGMGWFGTDSTPETVYTYSLDDKMTELLQRASRDTGMLGCRDWYSVSVLRNAGLMNGIMTGCPAWYDMRYLEQNTLRPEQRKLTEARKICVSDPARVENFGQMETLVQYLKENFCNTEIVCIFHRGPQQDKYTDSGVAESQRALIQRLEQMGVSCRDISYGSEGFAEYDDCALHIGFRVHAHIYNLSRRNVSVLIEEDGRGAGVNEALGLERICAYGLNAKGRTRNDMLMFQIEDALVNLIDTDCMRIENAFGLMQRYYGNMEKHVKSITKYI